MKITLPESLVPILHFVHTKEEKDELHEEVLMLERASFQNDPNAIEEILKTRVSKNIAHAIREVLSLPAFHNNVDAVRKFFLDLKNTVDTLPLLKLDLAFQPTEKVIEHLHDWVTQELGVGIVLDIGYDASIFGGSKIIFGGRYKEFTLSQMITDTPAKEKAAVLKLIT